MKTDKSNIKMHFKFSSIDSLPNLSVDSAPNNFHHVYNQSRLAFLLVHG